MQGALELCKNAEMLDPEFHPSVRLAVREGKSLADLPGAPRAGQCPLTSQRRREEFDA